MSKLKDNVIEKLTQDKLDLEAKLAILESKLKLQESKLAISSEEEELCKIEINRLYTLAKTRPLEWDEVKIFDTYVKALLAIKGKPEAAKKKSINPVTFSQEELLKIACAPDDDNNNEQ